jgi:hypothetical protein
MAFKTKALRYLGAISGRGVVKQNGETIAPAKFDLDGYYRAPVGVTGCGEIQLPGEVLKRLFGRTDLQLLTDQGLPRSSLFGPDAASGKRCRPYGCDGAIADRARRLALMIGRQ